VVVYRVWGSVLFREAQFYLLRYGGVFINRNSNDGNPFGWLAPRRIASGHGFESDQTDILV